MSAVNTTVSRISADRRRPIGNVSPADADQRGRGLFGFPQTGPGPLAQFRNRFGGGRETAPATPTGPTVPLTGEPVADPDQVQNIATRFGIPEGSASFEALENFFSTGDIAGFEELLRVTGKANEVTQTSIDILGGATPGGSPEAQKLQESLLEDPEAISAEVQAAAISKATDAILGAGRGAQQGLQENLAARGISDSGLSFALAQGGREAAGRGIAEARRDVLLQAGLAQSAREVQNQELLLGRTGQIESGALQVALGQAGLNELTEIPGISFDEKAANVALDAVLDAEDEEDADRRIKDWIASLGGGFTALISGQLARAGKPGLALGVGLLGLGATSRGQG